MSLRLRPLLLHLSLMAALLLAAVPTCTRLIESHRLPDAAALATRFCGSVQTPLHRLISLWQQEQALQQSVNPDDAGQHQDCDYCPLLAVMVCVALLVLALVRIREARWPAPPVNARIARLHPCGLGSRGPPVRL